MLRRHWQTVENRSRFLETRVMFRAARRPSGQSTYRRSARVRSASAGQVCYDPIVPHKNLWQFKDDEGAELACELEAMSANRVLLIVKRNGEPIVQETFADKRDALARSVGLHKEMSGKTRPADTPPPDQTS
jgi:hypothetical protein